MSNYWATEMIIESIGQERRRMAEAERRARPPRFAEADHPGGAGLPSSPGDGRREPGRGPRRLRFRGGPLTVLISFGAGEGARP